MAHFVLVWVVSIQTVLCDSEAEEQGARSQRDHQAADKL